MGRFWRSRKRVACPYYFGEREKDIVCNGIFSEQVQWKFNSSEDKKEWQKSCCYNCYEDCIHYLQLENLYCNSPKGNALEDKK